MQAQIGELVGSKCLNHHTGAQVRAANANVDDVGDALAVIAPPVTCVDAAAEVGHALQHLANLIRGCRASAQFDMAHSPMLGMVDRLAMDHALAPATDIGFLGQGVQ